MADAHLEGHEGHQQDQCSRQGPAVGRRAGTVGVRVARPVRSGRLRPRPHRRHHRHKPATPHAGPAIARHMVGVGQHLFDQAPHVGVVDHVVDAGPFPPAAHQAGQAQLGQVLGHRGRLGPHHFGQFVDRMLALEQGPDDPQSRLVAQQFEHPHGGPEFLGGRGFNYLRSHADKNIAKKSP